MYVVKVLAIFGLCGTAVGQEASPDLYAEVEEASVEAEAISYEVSLDFKSGYLDVNGFLNSDDPVAQLDVTVAFPNDWYVDLWVSAGIGSEFNSNYDDEVDLIVGWGTDLAEDLAFDANLSYIDLISIGEFKDEDFDAFQLELSLTNTYELSETASVSPYVKTQTLVSPEGDSIPWQTYAYLGVEHEWAFADELTLSQSAYALHDPGIYELDDGLVGVYQGSLSLAMSESVVWRMVMIEAATPITVDDEREAELVVGSGFTVGF
jgi:hypothetical protein